MAYFRLGEEPAARESYDRALRWMEEPELSEAEREEVTRFRAEAEQVLGIERDDEE